MAKQQTTKKSDTYYKTILLNNRLGLTPTKPRYSVIGDDCYGVYEDFYKIKQDTKNLDNIEVIEEPTCNTQKAVQKCYTTMIRKKGSRYIYDPITSGNEMVFLEHVGRLFERV